MLENQVRVPVWNLYYENYTHVFAATTSQLLDFLELNVTAPPLNRARVPSIKTVRVSSPCQPRIVSRVSCFSANGRERNTDKQVRRTLTLSLAIPRNGRTPRTRRRLLRPISSSNECAEWTAMRQPGCFEPCPGED